MRTFFAFLLAVAAFVPGLSGAMTLDEAYAAIPHQRTPFVPGASSLPKAQSDALLSLFTLSDRAMVLRVRGLRALQINDSAGLQAVLEGYKQLAAPLRGVATTPETRTAGELVIAAIRQHQGLFEAKARAGRLDAALTPAAHEASDKLKRAYSLLMAAFAGESAANKQAFFDHLCALDFL